MEHHLPLSKLPDQLFVTWFLQADAAQNGGHHHCCSALDVVIVAEELVAIRLQ